MRACVPWLCFLEGMSSLVLELSRKAPRAVFNDFSLHPEHFHISSREPVLAAESMVGPREAEW